VVFDVCHVDDFGYQFHQVFEKPLTSIDDKAESYAYTGILFGVVGCATGSIWARYTWGTWWTNDVKLNGAAIGLLIYFAYAILRGSFEDEQQKARISAIYNIFAIALLIPLLIILPRMTDSLHPGNGGNLVLNQWIHKVLCALSFIQL
jgi:heme exporter protein C